MEGIGRNQSGNKIKVLRIDNGKEYVNKNLQNLCEESGIQMQYSNPYTPRQNGVAERKNRSLKEMATCMIEVRDISPKIWVEAINCVAQIQNISFHKSVKGKTPYEAWFCHKPNVSNFRLDQEHGLKSLLKRGRHCSHKARNAS